MFFVFTLCLPLLFSGEAVNNASGLGFNGYTADGKTHLGPRN